MLFFWLVAVQARLYSVQYHVDKNFVEQSNRSNRPKLRDQCRFAMIMMIMILDHYEYHARIQFHEQNHFNIIGITIVSIILSINIYIM